MEKTINADHTIFDESMDCTAQRIAYASTGYFTPIVTDYLQGHKNLEPFYQYRPDMNGMRNAIEARKQFHTNRNLLVEELKKQYAGLTLSKKQESNLDNLLKANTFTITTAHQPNIFTGPLYFIYKILHAVKLAEDCKKEMPEYDFVPVFYMGSEDADLDELGYVNVGGEKLVWPTKQTGAVGRMKVDKALLKLIDAIAGQAMVHPYGEDWISLLKKAYTEGKTIQQATLEIVHALFAEYGLLVLIPDNANLKRVFNPVVKKELQEQFSGKAVQQTIESLNKHYKVQAAGREINLFYLLDDKRERITMENSKFKIQNSKFEFTEEEILSELQDHPDRFSANVILRGVFQETILPNIAFIGGGGELAYWLELKDVFATAGVPYPVLVLRNSFWWLRKNDAEKISKLKFEVADFFHKEDVLMNKLVERDSKNDVKLNGAFEEAQQFYAVLREKAAVVDQTLANHVNALKEKSLYRLLELEKKMLRAEKRKYSDQKRQINHIKEKYFPGHGLQERHDNLSLYYAQYGAAFIRTIYQHSAGAEQEFVVLTEK